jgi:Flp pilus assembly protein TadG
VRRGDDEGTITILVVGFTAILLLLVAVVIDVSAVVLARRGIASAADGAAVAAAQQLDQAALYAHGLDAAIPLSSADVTAVVEQYAADAREGQPGLTLEPGVDATGTTVTVVARREVTLPFVGWLSVGRSITVTAVARARAPVVAP